MGFGAWTQQGVDPVVTFDGWSMLEGGEMTDQYHELGFNYECM